MLSFDEIKAMNLTSLYVRDNAVMESFEFNETFRGRGGSNPDTDTRSIIVDIYNWDGDGFPKFIFGTHVPGWGSTAAILVAVIEDVAYFMINEKLITLRMGECYREREDGIAYDTSWSFYIMPISSKHMVLDTPIGRYEGEGIYGVPSGKGTVTFNDNDLFGRKQFKGFFLGGKAVKFNRLLNKDGSWEGVAYKDGIPEAKRYGKIILVDDKTLAKNPHGDYFDGLKVWRSIYE